MEVVRFNEADIIVASGLQPGATIRMNMGEAKPKDAIVSYKTDYNMADYDTWDSYKAALVNALGTKPLEAIMEINTDYTLERLLHKEFGGGLDGNGLKQPVTWTGSFYYDGEKFTKVSK